MVLINKRTICSTNNENGPDGDSQGSVLTQGKIKTKKEQSEEARNVCKRRIFTIEVEIGTKIKSDHSIEYIY